MRRSSDLILLLGILLALAMTAPHVAYADAVRDQYFKAENAHKKLLASPKQRKYRHNWLRVIRAFQKVYDKDPDGAWAAAGLYRAGATYIELFRRSGREADRDEGLKRLAQVRTAFSRSAYRAKAEKQIEAFPAVKMPPVAKAPPKEPRPSDRPAKHMKKRKVAKND